MIFGFGTGALLLAFVAAALSLRGPSAHETSSINDSTADTGTRAAAPLLRGTTVGA